MIGSILPVGMIDLPKGDKLFRCTKVAIVAAKEIERPDQLSKAGLGKEWKTQAIATSQIRDGYDLPFDDKTVAKNTVEAFEKIGYKVQPADDLPVISSFTKEEMTVHLFNHFNLKRITQ